MRIKELISESESDYKDMPLQMGKYRGPYDPRTMQPYSADHSDSYELVDIVEELIDDGFRPQVLMVNPAELTATQDWLSNYGSDEAMFPAYQDRPVVLTQNQIHYILDGHHRVAAALKANRQIQVYLFDELE
jgi:hypothetical protein